MLIPRLEIIAEHFIGANNLFLYKFNSAKNLLHFYYLELSLIPPSFYLSAVSRIYCGINFLKKEGVALGKTMQEQWMDQCAVFTNSGWPRYSSTMFSFCRKPKKMLEMLERGWER